VWNGKDTVNLTNWNKKSSILEWNDLTTQKLELVCSIAQESGQSYEEKDPRSHSAPYSHGWLVVCEWRHLEQTESASRHSPDESKAIICTWREILLRIALQWLDISLYKMYGSSCRFLHIISQLAPLKSINRRNKDRQNTRGVMVLKSAMVFDSM
jgi:hypothetical protein